MRKETEAFTLEQGFSSALSYLCDSSERGFQARLADRLGVLVADIFINPHRKTRSFRAGI